MKTKPTYSAGKAALFAFIPGMGAVYNRQYDKAVAHFGVFAALVVFSDEVEIFGLAAFVFYVFCILDAYRSAQLLEAGDGQRQGQSHHLNLPIWGSSLVFLGILFFLNNLGILSLRQLSRHSWPFLFIVAGLYLIFHHYLAGNSKPDKPRSTSTPAQAPVASTAQPSVSAPPSRSPAAPTSPPSAPPKTEEQ